MPLYNTIRFDWAIKHLLKDKANFVILEGFISELLQDNIKIHRILECKNNNKYEFEKFYSINILAESVKEGLFIIEIHNTRELYYFQRMLYGASKAITEHIQTKNSFEKRRKILSINIIYPHFGQGSDYIYRGITHFKGLHTGDTLRLSTKQRNTFVRENAGDIFPEYYVLRVNEFNDKAKTPLDEWMRFLKSGIIDEQATAKGLQAARVRLNVANMSEQERRAYERHMDNIRIQWDVLTTAHEEGKDEGIKEGIKEGILQVKKETAKKLLEKGLPLELIAECTGLSIDEIKKI